jgi:hypothetical protein
MKYVFALIVAISASTAAYAACSTSTTTYNGRMVTCTTCCMGNNCNTNCF